jgi:hypothetical protein
MDVIWGKREAESFCEGDWTGGIALIRFNKLAGTRIPYASSFSPLSFRGIAKR